MTDPILKREVYELLDNFERITDSSGSVCNGTHRISEYNLNFLAQEIFKIIDRK